MRCLLVDEDIFIKNVVFLVRLIKYLFIKGYFIVVYYIEKCKRFSLNVFIFVVIDDMKFFFFCVEKRFRVRFLKCFCL